MNQCCEYYSKNSINIIYNDENNTMINKTYIQATHDWYSYMNCVMYRLYTLCVHVGDSAMNWCVCDLSSSQTLILLIFQQGPLGALSLKRTLNRTLEAWTKYWVNVNFEFWAISRLINPLWSATFVWREIFLKLG